MKNLLKTLVSLVFLSFALNSCKTSSITKRHYNKGYYISHSYKKHKVKPNQNLTERAENLQATTMLQTVSDQQKTEPELLASAVKIKTGIQGTDSESDSDKKLQQKNNFEAVTSLLPVENFKKAVKIRPVPSFNSARDDSALSLIWVLIVLLIVAYLIGILLDGFGLGSLIHILGVIIVVLLILWLLRLI